jgi:Predicted NTP pyrophosphohydrolase
MVRVAKESAGLLMFRHAGSGIEVLLAHPGGPFWRDKDEGAWTIPKGLLDGQETLEAACREFEEETGLQPRGPFIELGFITQKAGKIVHAWAWEGDADPATMTSNVVKTEWPKGSQKWITVPEVDRCAWFAPEDAKRKINAAQAELIDRLVAILIH